MKYLKEYNENIDIHDLENCLQEIFDKFDIINADCTGYNKNFYYIIKKSKSMEDILKYPPSKIGSAYNSAPLRQGIVIGFDRKKLLPIKNEILQKKDMIQKRLGNNIIITTPPNTDYLFIYLDEYSPFNESEFIFQSLLQKKT